MSLMSEESKLGVRMSETRLAITEAELSTLVKAIKKILTKCRFRRRQLNMPPGLRNNICKRSKIEQLRRIGISMDVKQD